MAYFDYVWSNATTIKILGEYLNSVTGNYFGSLLLLAYVLVALGATMFAGFRRSSLFTAFTALIVSILLRSLNWVSDLMVLLCIGGLVLLIGYYWIKTPS